MKDATPMTSPSHKRNSILSRGPGSVYVPLEELEAVHTDQDVAERVHLEQVAVQLVEPQAPETHSTPYVVNYYLV